MRQLLAGVLFASACGHTEPFSALPSGAKGPLTPAPEAQLTIDSVSDFHWTSDGSGILITTTRPNERNDLPLLSGNRRKDPLDTCLGLLPAAGGSMTWQLCDRRFTHFRDSNDVFSAAAVGPDDRLLYVEYIGRPGFFFPVGHEAELWLSSTREPFASRRHLLTLYRDNNGRPTVPPDAINWISNLNWTGSNTFLALAHHLQTNSFLNTFGIARGNIGADTTTLSVIAGTQGVTVYSPAESGTTVVFVRPDLTLMSVPVAGGTARTVATLPPQLGRRISSLSCQGQLCLVVTGELPTNGQAVSNVWRLSLATGQAEIARTFADKVVPDLARLSPDGAHVVIRKGGRLYLASDRLP